MLREATACAIDDIDGGTPCDHGDLASFISNASADLEAEVDSCVLDGLINLCPMNGDTPAKVKTGLTGGAAESFGSQLQQLVADLFTTAYPGCSRPTGAVSADAQECAAEFSDVIGNSGNTEDMEKTCFFSCERARILSPSDEICVDDVLGDPVKQSVIDCEGQRIDNLASVEERCTNATVTELGCPLGASTAAELRQKLAERVETLVRGINLDIFHSDCRGTLPGEPTDPVPANVTLEPSLTKKKISCGQTIDAAFMNGNGTISFDSDLDCGPSKTATNGIVIAKSGIKLSGRAGKIWSIRGPQRSSLRTGAGIKLLPGVTRVQIRNFKAIENFGVGILDADDGTNKKLQIVKSTVRRNIQAGLRIRSQRAVIDQVVADKNGIGMDLSGDGIKVKGSSAKGSVYPPKVGIQLSGVDKNLSGSVVVISPLNTIELNGGIGIHVVSGAHVVNQNDIKSNVGNGIEIDPLAAGTLVKQNSLKFNAIGAVINGDQNTIDGNTAEENLGDGYVIGGNFNTVSGNGSGAKTDRGNGGVGYRVTGASATLDTNSAEANLGSGFVIEGTPTTLSSNTAEVNFGHGFEILSTGNTAQDSAAEGNNVADPQSNPFHEWVFVAGQIDGDGNKAGGDTIGLPSSAGFCDNDNDCPQPN